MYSAIWRIRENSHTFKEGQISMRIDKINYVHLFDNIFKTRYVNLKFDFNQTFPYLYR